jgi:hypothetical protein
VRLAAPAAAQRLVAEHEPLGHDEVRLGDEEPLALPHERLVAPAEAVLLAAEVVPHGPPHARRLERLHRRHDARHGRAGHGADEPVALVVAAEVLLLPAVAAAEQEQVPHVGTQVNDLVIYALAARDADVEELAPVVVPDVDAGALAPPASEVARNLSQLRARAHARESFD